MTSNIVKEDWQTKIDQLNEEAWAVRVSNSARAFALSKEAMTLSGELGYKEGLSKALRTYGFTHIRLSKYKEAKELLDEAWKLFDELGDENGRSDVLEYYGIIYRSCGNFDASLENLYKALDLRIKIGYKEGVALSNYHIGVTYKYLGNYEKALDNLLQSLAVARENHFWVAESYALNLIGQIYFETADFEQALNYYQQSLQIRRTQGDKWGEAGCLDNIGYTFYKLGDVEMAIRHCSESLAICRSISDKKGQANALFHIGELYRQKKEEEKAFDAARESLQIRREINDRKGQAEVLLFLADVGGNHQADASASLTRLTEALKLAEEIKAQDLLAKVHFHFYQRYKHNGEFDKALSSFETYNRLEKELHRDALAEKVVNLQISHRVEQAKKEAEIYRLRNDELAALNEELKKQKKETEQQKLIVEASLKHVKETQAQLVEKEKMASLGELTAGIAHEIQNPLNFINNFSEVNAELIDEARELLQNGETEEALACFNEIRSNQQKIAYHGRRADAIVKSMLQHSRSSSDSRELTDINALTEEYLRLSYHGYRAKDNTFQARITTCFDEGLEMITVAPQEIGRVLLNLYNNAFYAVNEKKKRVGEGFEPCIEVSTKQVDNRVEIAIRDNGVGIPKKVVGKIFQPFFTTKPAGEGTGLGLSLSYDIITKGHGGHMKVEAEEGGGASFTVLLPMSKKVN